MLTSRLLQVLSLNHLPWGLLGRRLRFDEVLSTTDHALPLRDEVVGDWMSSEFCIYSASTGGFSHAVGEWSIPQAGSVPLMNIHSDVSLPFVLL